jgi:hypothetical protein
MSKQFVELFIKKKKPAMIVVSMMIVCRNNTAKTKNQNCDEGYKGYRQFDNLYGFLE